MAPELLDCDNRRMIIPYSYASDVYALAVVVSSTLSMQPPYEGLGGFKVRNIVIQGQRPSMPYCSPQVKKILLQCYSTHPSRRPTANMVLQVLENVDLAKESHFFEQQWGS
uniref:Protein kinase domain-containing protein n=2 Tax=Aplanochytrium stocchinoi TaxID=215587 RepID=A0A7S3LSU7_9STRA